MITLDSVLRKLQIKLGAAVTTNELPVIATYVDLTTTTYIPGSVATATNSTTEVDFIPAPAASTQRQVKFISVQNQDTVAATVIVIYNDNATQRQILKVVLQINESLLYSDGEGFRVMDAEGRIKVTIPVAGGQLAKFSAYLNANQTIATGVVTKVTLDIENFDTNGYFDNATNYRFTPLIAGKYLVSGMVNFLNAVGAYTVSLYLYKNGALIRLNERAITNIVGNNSQEIVDIIDMNGSTDYLELFVLQNSGVNKTLLAGPSRTYFSGTMIP